MEYKVSIIIPTYKRGLFFLERAINSILYQTYRNIEIVLVDDNASEDSLTFRNIIQSYVTSLPDERVIYVQNKQNLGGSLARNEGIKKSTGSYITFLDDDDKYLPEKVANQLSFMIKNNLDMSFTDLRLCNMEDKTIDYREYSTLIGCDKNNLFRYHLTRHITGTPTFMYKKEVLDEIGGFPDVRMGQEFHLMFNTIEKGVSVGYLKMCDVIAYRHESGGISMGINKIYGEMDLYRFKKKFFDKLNIKEKMFIRFRHHAVMAVAYKRNRQFLNCLKETIFTFLSSPIDMILEFYQYLYKIKKVNSCN